MPALPRFSWRVLVASTTLALLAAVGTYVVLDHDDGPATTDPAKVADLSLTPDQTTPALDDLTFTQFDGKEVELSSLRGTPVVVNFFASYCTPCITEMPALQQVHEEVGGKVTFLGLAVSDRKAPAQALVRRTKVTYRTAQDPDGGMLAALQANVLPTTVLLDAQGKVVATHPGQLTAPDLRALLAQKLGVT